MTAQKHVAFSRIVLRGSIICNKRAGEKACVIKKGTALEAE
jgi:hypothetical protein